MMSFYALAAPPSGSFGSWHIVVHRRWCSTGTSSSSSSKGSTTASPQQAPAAASSGAPSTVQQHDASKKTQVAVATEQLQQWYGVAKKAAQGTNRAVRKSAKKAKSMTIAVIRDPSVGVQWCRDIWSATKHFFSWLATGFRLFRRNISTSFYLVKRVAKGYRLSLKERRLLVRTTADCLKLVPFSFFIIVPFAELALPFVLRFFPTLMPSTFFQEKYDNATLARKYKAKQQMAEFWQSVVAQRTEEILKMENPETADRAVKLQEFQDRLLSGTAFPTGIEIMRFSRLFEQEFQLSKMSPTMLKAMCQMLGLSASGWSSHTQMLLRHHINGLRREDRDYLWEGIDQLSHSELVEACKKRAIRFHGVSEDQMRIDLGRWLELSANRKLPTSLLLWIQTFYLSGRESMVGSSLADPGDFTMKVPTAEDTENTVAEAKEAFQSMVERQKASLESARTKLENLETEIVEVIQQPEVTPNGAGSEASAAEAVNGDSPAPEEESVLECEQVKKRRILLRVQELKRALKLHKKIVDRQRVLLSHQLEFMSNMRDNTPTQYQDAGRILLDQKVRLVEMMSSFAKDTEEIEQLLEEADKEYQLDREEDGDTDAQSRNSGVKVGEALEATPMSSL